MNNVQEDKMPRTPGQLEAVPQPPGQWLIKQPSVHVDMGGSLTCTRCGIIVGTVIEEADAHHIVTCWNAYEETSTMISEKSKITAIHGGGDWYDASVDYLVIPEGTDLDDEFKKYQKWYREIYCGRKNQDAYGNAGKRMQYMTFGQWLRKNCNARDVTGDELEIFEDI